MLGPFTGHACSVQPDVDRAFVVRHDGLVDIAVIKATMATKADVADAKTAIILWAVSAVVLAQLVPLPIKLLG